MPRRVNHSLLNRAKANKKDEFYTLYSDIERELQHYEPHFKNKIVCCNCDDVRFSNFYKYFARNFRRLKLQKLICSCYRKNNADLFNPSYERGFYYEYTGHEKINPGLDDVAFFDGDGDFRSIESIDLLKMSDIVVTNPPFSMFREYVSQLMKYEKQIINIRCINIPNVYLRQ